MCQNIQKAFVRICWTVCLIENRKFSDFIASSPKSVAAHTGLWSTKQNLIHSDPRSTDSPEIAGAIWLFQANKNEQRSHSGKVSHSRTQPKPVSFSIEKQIGFDRRFHRRRSRCQLHDILLWRRLVWIIPVLANVPICRLFWQHSTEENGTTSTDY